MDNIGFGCASLLGRYGKSDSIKVLEYAYSRGVRHYDVARSYGYGYAESLLGDVLSDHDDIKISTKFGVLPTRAAKVFSFAKPLVRPFMKKKVPGSLCVNYRNESIIDEVLLSKSMRQSMKSLKVDSLHRLFVHEPNNTWSVTSNLSDALNTLKNNQFIGDWGVSAYVNTVMQISRDPVSANTPCYQSSMNIFDYSCCDDVRIESVFSPFHRGYIVNVLNSLSGDELFEYEFSRLIGCDYADKSSAFWAVALLSSVTAKRIILATRNLAFLDENMEAFMFGKGINEQQARQAINLIKAHLIV